MVFVVLVWSSLIDFKYIGLIILVHLVYIHRNTCPFSQHVYLLRITISIHELACWLYIENKNDPYNQFETKFYKSEHKLCCQTVSNNLHNWDYKLDCFSNHLKRSKQWSHQILWFSSICSAIFTPKCLILSDSLLSLNLRKKNSFLSNLKHMKSWNLLFTYH